MLLSRVWSYRWFVPLYCVMAMSNSRPQSSSKSSDSTSSSSKSIGTDKSPAGITSSQLRRDTFKRAVQLVILGRKSSFNSTCSDKSPAESSKTRRDSFKRAVDLVISRRTSSFNASDYIYKSTAESPSSSQFGNRRDSFKRAVNLVISGQKLRVSGELLLTFG